MVSPYITDHLKIYIYQDHIHGLKCIFLKINMRSSGLFFRCGHILYMYTINAFPSYKTSSPNEGKPYENRNTLVQYNVYIHYICLQYSSHYSGLENANGGYPGHL